MADYDLADWEARLREALLIVPGLPVTWGDDTLGSCALAGITDHSFLFPWLTRATYVVDDGQQDWLIYPVSGPTTDPAPVSNPEATSAADLIAVVGVELPRGTPIPQGAFTTTPPAGSAASRALRADAQAQGYVWHAGQLHLRQPATGDEVGDDQLLVTQAQTWLLPDLDNTIAWNGPVADVPLVLLLAKRAAYETLAEWQVRIQGFDPATIIAPDTNIHIDVPPILAALEVQIARALELRANRSAAYPPFPAGR